ncbi:GtrA family protein [Mumia sp.]|uniref:GtrA family protein n=1 Tax=Mumia sp. TaxID=1965300 RepID=UPI00260B87CD|nr:GtrA family protein [Mumia sp.]MDD9349009.1 GtrA family protein [Mumia sp.]
MTSSLSPSRVTTRLGEVARFGTVGLAGYVTDVVVFNLLRYAGDPGVLEHKPVTAKILSVAVAMIVTYVGNRQWTWRGRSTRSVHREVVLFVVMNGIGMLIAVGCLAFSHYVLGLDSALADNISANVVGLGLGTLFRFWAYRRFVFPDGDLAEPS